MACRRKRHNRDFTKQDWFDRDDLGTNVSRLPKKFITTCCRGKKETESASGCTYEN